MLFQTLRAVPKQKQKKLTFSKLFKELLKKYVIESKYFGKRNVTSKSKVVCSSYCSSPYINLNV